MSNVTGKNTPDKSDSKKPKKKINGFIVFALLLLVIFIATYRPSITRIHCNDDILASNPKVIMLGTWWCPYCSQARQYLHNEEISYCEYDIEKSAIGKKLYDDANGSAIPLLIIGNYLLQGFDESSIDKALMLLEENNEHSK